MSLVEAEGLVEGSQDTGSFLIGEEGGKSDSRMIINGDVQTFDTRTRVAVGAVTGGADAGLVKTAQLFNIQMEEFAGNGAFVTDDRRLGRIERGETIEAMALEDAGKGSFGDGKNHQDLSVGTALAAKGEDLSFELRRCFAWLVERDGGMILQTFGKAGRAGALEPFADGFFGDAEGGGRSAQGGTVGEVMLDQFCSHERGECGISVHSVRGVWLAVGSASTTNLPEPSRADNLLKHDI